MRLDVILIQNDTLGKKGLKNQTEKITISKKLKRNVSVYFNYFYNYGYVEKVFFGE